jgi:propanol-preferring alcohol dehydrogenase
LKHGEPLLKTQYCGVYHIDVHVKNAGFGNISGTTLGHKGIAVDINDAQLVFIKEMGASKLINLLK